ncbi:NAD(P)-binding protein [Rhizophagus irregularis]|uniref:NAD(P)-binding protein n=1 Tax=Rhizophagus irregularis TaxID=588596 RepID=A0A2N0S2L5_9GLOM|nr:NAD(P)-binding protein [Rhizophagus irregularis]
MSSQFKTVTIAGGTGTLGYHIVEAFLNDGSYNVKVLRRKPKTENEKAKLLASKGAEIIYADYDQKDELVEVLKGTDVVISVLSYKNTNLYESQVPLLVAAKEASVKRFIPSEFVHPTPDNKIKFEEELINSGLEYTIIFNGLFQEYLSFIGFDAKNKKATFYADGNKKLHTTSLSDVGKYTVETLKMPEARNAVIKVAGATLSLNEYLQKFEEVSGEHYSTSFFSNATLFKNVGLIIIHL